MKYRDDVNCAFCPKDGDVEACYGYPYWSWPSLLMGFGVGVLLTMFFFGGWP